MNQEKKAIVAAAVRKSRQRQPVNVSEVVKKPFLTEYETAALTSRAVNTLKNERHLRRGIPYHVIGQRSIRYKLDDVLAYMEKQRISFDEEGVR